VKLSDVKLGAKLYGMLGLMLAMMAMIAGVGLLKANDIASRLSGLVKGEFAAMEELEHSRGLMLEARMAYDRAMNSPSIDKRRAFQKEGVQAFEEAQEHLSNLAELAKDHGTGAESEALLAAWKEYGTHYLPLFDLAVESPSAAAKSPHLKMAADIGDNKVPAALDAADVVLLADIEQAVKDSDSSVTAARMQIAFFFLLAAAMGAVSGALLVRSITQPVAALMARMRMLNEICLTGISGGLKALAEGDLTYPVEASTKPLPQGGKDEFGQLANTFNEMLAKAQACVRDLNGAQAGLTEVVSAIKDRAHQVWNTDSRGNSQGVALALKEVTQTMSESAHTAQEMAGGSESLARVAGDAAATMDQVDRSIINVNDAAAAVLTQAETMAEGANTGMESLDKMVRALKEMAAKSDSSMIAVRQLGEKQDEINSIVQTIEEIADQTNLLALNAAIEAARAGEHGRGFAVVAEEVRKLAERAASSTQQISSLIDEVRASVALTTKEMASATESVKQGQALSEEASVVLSQIASGAIEVRELAVAAQTQATALAEQASQVTGMVSNVASISEESAAGSEEISAGLHEVSASAGQVSEDLSIIASGLASDVERFRLKAA